MRGSMKRMVWLSALALAALMAVGVVTAGANRGGPGDRGPRGLGGSTSALVTEAAKQLDVSRAKLVDAIQKSAVTRINEAVEDGDVDADDAADLKEEVADNLSLAMMVSTTRTVASNLGVTTAKLNTEFRDARRTLLLARINAALEDEDITQAQATELKNRLDDADLPGYKVGGFVLGGGFGFGRGR